MLSIGRLFGLIVLFLFFEIAVWVMGRFLLPDVNSLLVCTAMTGLALGVWIVYVLVTRWQSRPPAAAPVTPGPVQAALPSVPTPESNDLKVLIREAEDRLAASPGFSRMGTRPRLDQLPIYIVAGPAGSGKTSSLANCGLDPRLLAGESYRDTIVVPTKLCNIWYAGDAVWIDVSGRLFDDDAAWRGLLNLLTGQEKKSFIRRLWEGNNSRQPIRGLVLFCDANIFLRSPDPQQISALSRRLQERLQTAGQVIGAGYPVYTILSKSDAIPYFADYFNRLSEQEDRQVLGFTLPSADSVVKTFGEVYTESENKRLSEYWTRLYQSLSDKRLTFLGREPSAEKKPFIYEFPREVKRIRAEVVRFLVDTFRPNPLHPGAQLRGFYLGGIRKVVSRTGERQGDFTQVKAGSDATMLFKAGDLSQALAATGTRRPAVTAQQETAVSRWSFLSEVFHRIVPADRGLAPAVKIDRFAERQSYFLFGSVAVVGLLLAIAFFTSWYNNRQLLKGVGEAVAGARFTQPPLAPDNIVALESLRTQLALLTEYDRIHKPWNLRWGLYSGDDVRPDLRTLYFARFRQAFLDPILASQPKRFASLNPGSPTESYDAVYDGVKVYRTITSGECKPDSELLGKTLPGLAAEGQQFNTDLARRQIDFYISELMAADPYERKLKEDRSAVTQAQEYLSTLKGPDQFYRALIADVNQAKPPARLQNYAPDYAKVLTGPTEVAGSFTREGWDAVQQKIHEGKSGSGGDSCVVGNRLGAMVQGHADSVAVQNLYAKDYIDKWQAFLAQQGVVRYRDLSDAVQKLDILSGNRSPMLEAILMVAENTNFPPSQPGAASAVAKAAEDSFAAKLNNLLPKGKKAQDAAKDVLPPLTPAVSPTDVFNVFQPARMVVNPGNRERLVDDSNKGYLDSLETLKAALEAFPRDHNATPDNALIDAAHHASDGAHNAVRQVTQRFNIASSKGTDDTLRRYLEMPIEYADRLIPATVDAGAKVNGQLKLVCDSLRTLQRKYPFNPKADAETTVPELIKLFAPRSGLIWSFQTIPQMPELLTPAGDQWIQNPAVQQFKLTPDFLNFFNSMARVSKALFPEGSYAPHLQYTVQPMPSDGVQEVNVTVDGVQSSTGHAGQFSWPPPSGSSTVEIRLTINAVGVPFGRYEDTWAIFRLMDDAEPRQPGQNVYTFRSLRQGHGAPQNVTDTTGKPVAVRLLISFPAGFDPRNFNVSCPHIAAQ
jgi:type VI secretion system protein ImpL